ncbi:LysE family translocator [Dongia deserti]|uniref:LysE family translocator n=1 Tax=Dongia deserti TaxID=2268030 RepID=UPI000E657393|nr:LysE family transporter [Dongia deserti]
MDPALALVTILGTLAIGAMSPGPSFVVVVRASAGFSRRDGLAAALGMGCGGLAFAGLALAGLQAVLMQVSWLYLVLKIAGGAYLMYLGYRIWRGARTPLPTNGGQPTAAGGWRRSFVVALVTQLSNPKTAIWYASVFAAFLPHPIPTWMFWTLLPLIFALEAGWYTIVALAFSAARPRAIYLGAKLWIDRFAGGLVGLLGGRLIMEAVRGRIS